MKEFLFQLIFYIQMIPVFIKFKIEKFYKIDFYLTTYFIFIILIYMYLSDYIIITQINTKLAIDFFMSYVVDK